MPLLKTMLSALTLLAVLAGSAHAKQDPVTPKVTASNFVATYKTWPYLPETTPYNSHEELVAGRVPKMKADAAYLLMIKNGISLYRKGALDDNQIADLRWFIQEVGKIPFEFVRSEGRGMTPEDYELARLLNMYYKFTYSISMDGPHMVSVSTKSGRTILDIADEAYERALRQSREFGVEQVWVEKK